MSSALWEKIFMFFHENAEWGFRFATSDP